MFIDDNNINWMHIELYVIELLFDNAYIDIGSTPHRSQN